MSNRKKILIVLPIHSAGIDLLKNNDNYEFEILEDSDLIKLETKINNCDGLTLRTSQLPGEIISKGKSLKIISRHGVGYDNIDLKYCKNNNIKIAITATANAVAVAEHVFFMMLSLCKRKEMFDATVRSGNFKDKNKLPSTMELWKKNILIAGFGRIGKSLIKRCLGFEMNVYVYDPYVSEDEIKSFGGTKVELLEDSLANMDFVSLHLPLNDKTKNLININNLKMMKKNSIIINAARGGIINEKDLNLALNENYIFGAGLDVFSIEPPEKDNPLLKNNKTILSPHTAALTEECRRRMGIEAVQNLIDFFENKLDKSKIVKL